MLTLVNVQHEAVEVNSLFFSVFHMRIKQIHEHGFPCALKKRHKGKHQGFNMENRI